MRENNKGITLISLTIMIVVLLILATIGITYNSGSIKFAQLTKFITEFELINTRISILNQNREYESEYANYGLDETNHAEIISEIDALLEDKLANVYGIEAPDIDTYKSRFQYYSEESISEKLGIDGIEGSYLVNIQNKIVISFDGIQYEEKTYYTIEELEQDGLATNKYKVKYYSYENPYIAKGHYYVAGNWDTGYVISDSQDDAYNGNETREITTTIVNQSRGNVYMWIPVIEKVETHMNGIDWSNVISNTDYTNIKTAIDAYKATYEAPEYASDWYTTSNAQYAYRNTANKLIEYPNTEASEDDTKNILNSIYSNGGVYIKIHNAIKQVEYIQSTGTQYIDTGYIPDNNTSVEIQVELQSLHSDTGSNKGIFGTRTTATSNSFSLICGGNNLLYTAYGTTNAQLTMELSKDVLYTFKKQKNATIVNGETIATIPAKTFTSPYNLVLFAVRNGNEVPEFHCSMKLYYCKIWDGDLLIRDYIPVLDKNETACLYDKVEGKYYYNQGTEAFLYQ